MNRRASNSPPVTSVVWHPRQTDGDTAPAADPLAVRRRLLLGRLHVRPFRPMAGLASDVREAGPCRRDVPGPARLKVAGDVAPDAGGIAIAPDPGQRGEGARVLRRLPEGERGGMTGGARGRAGVARLRLAGRGVHGGRGGRWMVGSDADGLPRRRPANALPVVSVDQNRDAILIGRGGIERQQPVVEPAPRDRVRQADEERGFARDRLFDLVPPGLVVVAERGRIGLAEPPVVVDELVTVVGEDGLDLGPLAAVGERDAAVNHVQVETAELLAVRHRPQHPGPSRRLGALEAQAAAARDRPVDPRGRLEELAVVGPAADLQQRHHQRRTPRAQRGHLVPGRDRGVARFDPPARQAAASCRDGGTVTEKTPILTPAASTRRSASNSSLPSGPRRFAETTGSFACCASRRRTGRPSARSRSPGATAVVPIAPKGGGEQPPAALHLAGIRGRPPLRPTPATAGTDCPRRGPGPRRLRPARDRSGWRAGPRHPSDVPDSRRSRRPRAGPTSRTG